MKKFLSSLTVIVLVIGMLCFTCMLSFGAVSAMSGRGIVDDATYCIYNTTNGTHYFMGSILIPSSGQQSVTALSKTNSQNSTQWSSTAFRWTVDKQTNGTFTIKGIGNKYLKVTEDENLTFALSPYYDQFKFDIQRTENGTYTIQNGDLYLSRSGNSIELTSTKNEYSYWTFMAVDQGKAQYYGYEWDDFNSIFYNENIERYFDNWGYNATVYYEPVDSNGVMENMTENDITIIGGEGDNGFIVTNPHANVNSMIMADYEITSGYMQQYITDLPYGALSKSRCIIYASTKSGEDAIGNDGSDYNLVDVTYNAGAHFVLGFKENVTEEKINYWLVHFVDYSNDYMSIGEAIYWACYMSDLGVFLDDGSIDYSNFIYYKGDINQFLYFNA